MGTRRRRLSMREGEGRGGEGEGESVSRDGRLRLSMACVRAKFEWRPWELILARVAVGGDDQLILAIIFIITGNSHSLHNFTPQQLAN